MLVANLHALGSSIALMTWTKPRLLFEPILVFLESAQISWTSPFTASLKRLALSLVIGPLENDKGSCANSAPFRSYPMRNWKFQKNSKIIQKIKKYNYGFISGQNRLKEDEKERK